MYRHLFKIALLSSVAILSAWFYMKNSQAVVVSFGAVSYNSPLALVVICAFSFGLLLSAFFGCILALQYYARERALKKSTETALLIRRTLAQSEDALQSREFEAAKRFAEKVLSLSLQDPDALLLLARIAEQTSGAKVALGYLDTLRANALHHPRVLFYAALLHEQVGDDTSAYDNLAILLKTYPENREALRRIVDVADRLRRYTDAIHFQEELIRRTPPKELGEARARLADLLTKKARTLSGEKPEAARKELEAVLKLVPDFPMALSELANLDLLEDKRELATKRLTTAYQKSFDVSFLSRILRLWLAIDEPSRALSALRNSLDRKKGGAQESVADFESRLGGHVFLLASFLHLGMIDDGKEESEILEKLLLDARASEFKERYGADILFVRTLVLRVSQGKDAATEFCLTNLSGLKIIEGFQAILAERKLLGLNSPKQGLLPEPRPHLSIS